MLQELYVENFGLIEKIVVNFSAGLNVITGETGAGKSLIIDAVGFLIGGRGSQEFIRFGADKLLVQGTFNGLFSQEIVVSLSDAGFDLNENTLILNREFSRSGKNICRINCRVVPLSFYKDMGKKLLNIHGQHEHINLLEERNQIILLDSYGGVELLSHKDKVKEKFGQIKTIKKEYDSFQEKIRDAAKKIDFLNFQVKEIEEAGLMPNEDEELEKERKLLQNAEKLARDSRLAYTKLYGSRQTGACDLVNEALELLKELCLFDEKIAGIFEKVREIYFELDDIARELGKYCENIISDPARLDEIETRMTLINKLKKKYGVTISEILQFWNSAKKELEELENQEENIKNLEETLINEQKKYDSLSRVLTNLRKKAAEQLSSAITKQLHQLFMPFAEFSILIEESQDSIIGKDRVEFLISPNRGEELKPVMRIASGGEMSRIMLGIKVIIAQLDQIPTLIFDEIDSGLGGKVLYAVAEKMGVISSYTQVICVTHSPVIASFADNHLYITKEMMGERTVTKIKKLNQREIVEELCRMLAGDHVTETTVSQAKELIKIGQLKKNY